MDDGRGERGPGELGHHDPLCDERGVAREDRDERVHVRGTGGAGAAFAERGDVEHRVGGGGGVDPVRKRCGDAGEIAGAAGDFPDLLVVVGFDVGRGGDGPVGVRDDQFVGDGAGGDDGDDHPDGADGGEEDPRIEHGVRSEPGPFEPDGVRVLHDLDDCEHPILRLRPTDRVQDLVRFGVPGGGGGNGDEQDAGCGERGAVDGGEHGESEPAADAHFFIDGVEGGVFVLRAGQGGDGGGAAGDPADGELADVDAGVGFGNDDDQHVLLDGSDGDVREVEHRGKRGDDGRRVPVEETPADGGEQLPTVLGGSR